MASVPFQMAQNDVKSISNPARVTAIGGDNATEFNLFFPNMPPGSQWVFPFTYGFMYVVDSPSYMPVKVDASQTPPGSLTPPASTKIANLAAYNTDQVFNPGIVATAATAGAIPAPGNINATLAAAASTPPLAAVIGKTVTIYDIYLMLDAASATPAGGLLLQDSAGATFGAMSAGVVNPPPWHGGPQGVKLLPGLGFRILNNSGASVTIRGSVINTQV